MARYHIKKDGTPGVCHAQPGKCPLGGEGQHSPTAQAAQQSADSAHSNSFVGSNNRFSSDDVKSDNDKSAATALAYTRDESTTIFNAQGVHDNLNASVNEIADYKNNSKSGSAIAGELLTNVAKKNNLLKPGDKIVTTGISSYLDSNYNKFKSEDDENYTKYAEATKDKTPVTLSFSKMKDINPDIATKLETSKRNSSETNMYIQHGNGSFDKLDDSAALMLNSLYNKEQGFDDSAETDDYMKALNE